MARPPSATADAVHASTTQPTHRRPCPGQSAPASTDEAAPEQPFPDFVVVVRAKKRTACVIETEGRAGSLGVHGPCLHRPRRDCCRQASANHQRKHRSHQTPGYAIVSQLRPPDPADRLPVIIQQATGQHIRHSANLSLDRWTVLCQPACLLFHAIIPIFTGQDSRAPADICCGELPVL